MVFAYAWYPHTDRSIATAGTIAAAAGGPAAGINAVSIWQDALAPALARFDLLVWDYRGFGGSSSPVCGPPLNLTGPDTPELQAGIRACGERLGAIASQLTIREAVDDLDDLRAALGLERLDLVGESFGTFFAQAYALRYPTRLRSLTLDSTIPLDPDPWYVPALRHSEALLGEICAASPGCPQAFARPTELWSQLVGALRAQPDDEFSIADLARELQNTFPTGASGREALAAAAAYLQGDLAPLRRLMAERLGGAEGADGQGLTPEEASDQAAGIAFRCDFMQMPFDRLAAPDVRRAQAAEARAALPPSTFAPYLADEYPLRPYELCYEWPAPPSPPEPRPTAAYPEIPTLLLSGQHDTATTPEEARLVARRFPQATLVEVPGANHGVSFASACAAQKIANFLDDPAAPLPSAACAQPVPFRVLTAFATTSQALTPAALEGGGPSGSRAVAAAVATAADAAARRSDDFNYDVGLDLEQEPGLRGGLVTFEPDDGSDLATLRLEGVRYVGDVAVSGTVVVRFAPRSVEADLQVEGEGGESGTLRASWTEGGGAPTALVQGEWAGAPFTGTAPVP